MLVEQKRFKCDLCGKYRSLGVRETKAQNGEETVICGICIAEASDVIADAVVDLTDDAADD